MEHPESVTAVVTANEPPTGTVLIVKQPGPYGAEYKVIWRDDDAQVESYGFGDPHAQRWLEEADTDPMSLHQHLKYADAVYALGMPLAVFNR